ncbi:nitrate- and nitrite sensing domain-containing protein [Streptomyces sp. MB09-01]|uniref:sensor histidine kinase n=1 Tax=Streptomyces sp. MB09-01 TaxID=3028666 RepID=UPI0029BC7F34|nr:nitrate- and nitrite sensing domain-containing protein [Streptomyces sp. MB09-01]MDX3537174.1 nitrate- and nitrite sensing domain-containing protein [Streptomyces sp. MB09-01]
MQKKRSRKNGTAADGPAPAGRRVRVRRRLVVGVAVAGLTVLAAGAPAVVTAARELNDSQRLVTLAEQTGQILTVAHVLADERDAVVEYAAKGRPGAARGALQERIGRTDRQIAEAATEVDEPLAVALARVATVRTEAIDGKGTALAAHQAYTGVITELLAPGGRLAELTPPRAEAALTTTRPLAPLGQAVEQASATRGLLLAALAVPRGEQLPGSAVADELTTAAQRSRVRELAALDDFARAARPDVRQTLTATVTGPEVKTADDFLKRLTDRPTLNPADRKTDGAAVGSALTARIDRMRTVEATLAGQRASALASLRDDDVTRLETLVAVLGLLFLIAVGVSTAVARSLTRPLSVLRRGAARLATPEGSVEPVRFTGRNDEFAEVVRHLNAVRDQTVSLHTRIAGLDADRRRIIGRNEALTASRDVLEEELVKLRAGLEEHRRVMSTTSVSLSLRTLGLVERQLAVIEELESKEQDPDRLATLFKLDHLATVMRRHNENLLVLAGQEHGHGQVLPVPLVDVMRAAVSEIERYERVDLAALPSYTQVAGHAADDLSHVLAELLENATTFSPPEVKVKVSGWTLDSGDVVLSVVDEGIGVTGDRLESLNSRLSTPEAYDEEPEAEHGLGLGLYVAGRLAARHGVTAELRAGRHGGTEALVVVPAALLPATPPVSPVHTLATPGAPALHLPGVIAEANENTLPPRRRGTHAAPDPTEQAATDATEPAAPASADATEPADSASADAVEPADSVGADAAEPAAPATDAAEPAAPAADAAGPVAPETDAVTEPELPTDAATSPAEPAVPAADNAAAAAAAAAEPAVPAQADTEAEPAFRVPTTTVAPVTLAEALAGPALPAEAAEPTAEVEAPFPAPAEAGLPPADQIFTAAPPADQAFPAEPPAADVPADQAFPAEPPAGAPAGDVPADQAFPAEPPAGAPAGDVPADQAFPAEPPAAGAPAGDVPADQVFTAGPPAGDPHRHAPAEGNWLPRQGSHPADTDDAVTDKGLPKRTPRTVTAGRADDVRPPAPPRRIDADELRRRLGGFYQGAQDGRRVAAAELAQEHAQDQGQGHSKTDQGDTAQEART